MPKPVDPVYAARSRIAVYSHKDKRGDPAKVLIARRELAFAKLEKHVRTVLGDLGPLSPGEHARVLTLLSSEGGER